MSTFKILFLTTLIQQILGRVNINPLFGQPQAQASDYNTTWFDQKLDHFLGNETMFKQRYYIRDVGYNPTPANINGTRPIFMFICGESTCNPPSLLSAPMQLGTNLGAVLIALEHRYFGESQPFNNTQGGWSVDNLHYLSSKQALADAAYFIDNELAINLKYNVSNIVMIGGSYPGAYVAWFKHMYPDHIKAVWSSSGVIHANEWYTEFDRQLHLSAERSQNNCSKNWATGMTQIERIFTDGTPSQQQDLKNLFGINGTNIRASDFMSFASDIFTASIQYGMRGIICNMLETTKWRTEPVQTLFDFNDQVFRVDPTQYSMDFFSNTTMSFSRADRAWNWLICTEFGWFQGPNQIDYPIHSQLLTLEWYREFCQTVFFKEIAPPQVDATNALYGGYGITGKNIMFMTAAEDPWQYVGMRYLTDPEGTQAGFRTHYINCNGCAHCVDLHGADGGTPPALFAAWDDINETISKWLDLKLPNQSNLKMIQSEL